MANDGDFDIVVPGRLEDYPVTPDVQADPDFRGIRIAAPREVKLSGHPDGRGGFARFIVCGAYHLDSNYFGLREDFLDHILLCAVNARTHRAYIARLPGLPNALPRPDPFKGMSLGPDDWAGRSIIEFFNTNLVTALGLPAVEAEYIAYATLGRYVSNVVRTRLA